MAQFKTQKFTFFAPRTVFFPKKRPHMSNGMKTPYQMRKMSLENLELNRTDTIFDPYTKAKTI